MARVRGLLAMCLLGGVSLLLATGCAGGAKQAEAAAAPAKPTCAHPAGWQRLANRIKAPVYCPGWLPDPLVGQIGGKWNNINSVSRDRSYLESFVWQETEAGLAGGNELHVNLRAYPGRTRIPTCRTGGVDSQNVPCFADPGALVTANGITARLYTVNQDADTWHYLLLWRRFGNLYTLSEHLAPPLTGPHLKRYLKHELASLVLIRPTPAS
jgi:hypothetical protein